MMTDSAPISSTLRPDGISKPSGILFALLNWLSRQPCSIGNPTHLEIYLFFSEEKKWLQNEITDANFEGLFVDYLTQYLSFWCIYFSCN